jgi:hypothetical protein
VYDYKADTKTVANEIVLSTKIPQGGWGRDVVTAPFFGVTHRLPLDCWRQFCAVWVGDRSLGACCVTFGAKAASCHSDRADKPIGRFVSCQLSTRFDHSTMKNLGADLDRLNGRSASPTAAPTDCLNQRS